MKHFLQLTSVSVFIFLCACSPVKTTAKNKAISDFNNGIMQIETFGLRMPNSPYENYLAKHGIKMKTVAGCVVNDRIVKHASAYNKEMKQRIKQKLGRDIFAEASKKTTQ